MVVPEDLENGGEGSVALLFLGERRMENLEWGQSAITLQCVCVYADARGGPGDEPAAVFLSLRYTSHHNLLLAIQGT